MLTRGMMTAVSAALALVLLPGVAVAADLAPPAVLSGDRVSHGIAVEYAPAERFRLNPQTDAYVQGVAPPTARATVSDPLDKMLTAAGRLPEPATWGLMILGFGGIAGAMRHRVRKSERDFNDRIRRITQGEE